MKPKENKPQEVYRIIVRATGKAQGSYSRAYCDEYDFNSTSEARNANCHGLFKSVDVYAINKYKVIYELIEEDVRDKEAEKSLIQMEIEREEYFKSLKKEKE